MTLVNMRKEFDSLKSNWIDDEEKHYSEYAIDIIQDKRYKDCHYHKKLIKDLITPYEIPSSKLAEGYDYTSLRRLEDFFNQQKNI